MEQENFHQLIVTLKNAQDKQIRQEAEAQYFAFRASNPSDSYIQLICNEIVSAPEQQYRDYASVLLRQDIEKQDEQCCFKRMKETQNARKTMLFLMSYAAQHPNMFLTQIIRQYTVLELSGLQEFPEIFQFIEQAYNVKEHEEVREMAVSIVAGICTLDPKHFPTVLDFLHIALSDESDIVCLQAANALHNLIQYDEMIESKNLTLHVKYKIALSILTRITPILNNGRYEIAKKMLEALGEIIDLLGEDCIELLPQIIEFLQQIMLNNDVTEDLKCKSVYIFDQICGTTEKIRKQLQEQVITFFKRCVVTNLSKELEDEQTLQNWCALKSIKEADYDDQSLESVCEQCVTSVSILLGARIIKQIIMEYLNQNDALMNNFGINMLKEAAEPIYGQLKQQDVNTFTSTLLKQLTALPSQTNNNDLPNCRIMRHKYDIIECISLLSGDFSPMIQKNHKNVVMPLINIYNQETSILIKQVTVNALFQFTKTLAENVFFDYSQHLLHIVKECFSSEYIENQIQGLDLLSVITTQQDDEENIPLFNEFMPGIFHQFGLIMESMQTQQNFTCLQLDFVEAVLKQLQASIDSVPSLFESNIDQLMKSYIFILNRSLQQQEFTLLQQDMDAISSIIKNDQFKSLCEQYIIPIFEQFKQILSQEIEQIDTNPENEGDMKHDDNMEQIQTQACLHLHILMETHPTQFIPMIEQIYQLINNLPNMSADLCVGKLSCFASLVTVAAANPQQTNFCNVNQMIFQIFEKEINTIGDQTIVEFDLTDYSDLTEALGDYIASYSSHISKNNDYSQYSIIMPKLIEYMSMLFNKAHEAFKELCNDVMQSDEYDDDQQAEEIQNIFDDYDEFLDNLGSAYSELIMNFGEKIDPTLLRTLLNVAVELQKNGTESDAASVQVTQAIGLYGDIFQFCGAEISKMVYQEVFQMICDTITQVQQPGKEDWQLLHVCYFALQMYLENISDNTLASNQLVLNTAVSLLDRAKEDGHEHALSLFDELCSYLAVSGWIGKQSAEFWSALADYAIWMETGQDEVVIVLRKFLKLLTNQEFQVDVGQFEQKIDQIVVRLFFGQFYSVIKNFEENKDIVDQIRNRVAGNMSHFKNWVSVQNNYVKKNFAAFCADAQQ